MTYYVAMHAYTKTPGGFDALRLHGRSRAVAAEVKGSVKQKALFSRRVIL